MLTTTSARPARAARRELAPLVPLALVTGISPLATDMYIPGLPELAADLHTTAAVAQLTLTAFLVAFAGGQILLGPLSDAVGRRRLVLVGAAAFVVASILYAVSSTAPVLLAARVVQGLASAAGSVAARAMVTDVLAGVRRARVIASLSAINAVGPVVAPLIGGALLGVGTWRLSFWLLAGVGVALFVSVLVSFPETLPPGRRSAGVGLAASGRRMGSLLRIPRFTLYLITSCVATVGFFAYIATSASVFQTFYGYSSARYTLVFATNASCMIISALVFGRVVGRVSEDRLLTIGLAVGAVAPAGVLTCALLHLPAGLVGGCLALVTGAQGLVITGSATRTQALGAASPGSAALSPAVWPSASAGWAPRSPGCSAGRRPPWARSCWRVSAWVSCCRPSGRGGSTAGGRRPRPSTEARPPNGQPRWTATAPAMLAATGSWDSSTAW